MTIPNLNVNHIGRKIERIRELKGIKQEVLAGKVGLSQQTISKIEQSEDVDDEKLARIAEALNVTTDIIRNFNEDAANNFINTFHDQSGFNYHCTFNPLDKYVEAVEENKKLYERLLQVEREKNDLLQAAIKKLETP